MGKTSLSRALPSRGQLASLVDGCFLKKMPFVMVRNNTVIVLIDVRNRVAYMFAHAPIKANLFGHGDILKVVQAELNLPGGGRAKVTQLWTVMQYSEQAQQAAVVCVQLPADLNLALTTLVKID